MDESYFGNIEIPQLTPQSGPVADIDTLYVRNLNLYGYVEQITIFIPSKIEKGIDFSPEDFD